MQGGGKGSSIMTMRIIFQKSHSSFRKTNGHESRIRLGLDESVVSALPILFAFIHRVRKRCNQFFEEEASRLSLATMARVKSTEGFRGKHMDGQLAHGSAAYTVHPVPS